MNRYASIHQLLNEVYNSPQVRFDYDDTGKLIYSATHKSFDQSINNDKWEIKKYYYDNNDNLVLIKKRTGAWSQRDFLDWGIIEY